MTQVCHVFCGYELAANVVVRLTYEKHDVACMLAELIAYLVTTHFFHPNASVF